MHRRLWDRAKTISAAMLLQSQNATGQVGVLTGCDQLIHLNAPPLAVGEKPINIDDYVRGCDKLPGIAKRLIDDDGNLICARFLFTPAD